MSLEEIHSLGKKPLEHNGTLSSSTSKENKTSKKAYIESYGCML